jgi:hypothetical protein
MMDSLLNLLFRCSHRRLSRPLAATTKAGQPQNQTYVVCLDCGKQFLYDLDKMRMGKAIDQPPLSPGGQPGAPAVGKKTKFALFAAIPAAVTVGTFFAGKKRGPSEAGSGRDGSR